MKHLMVTAANQLCEENLHVAKRAAWAWSRRTRKSITSDVLYSTALMGLVNASRRFDPYRGASFQSNAYKCCSAEVAIWFSELHYLKPSQRRVDRESRLDTPAPGLSDAPVAGSDGLPPAAVLPARKERFAIDDRDQVGVLLERVDDRVREMIQVYYAYGISQREVGEAFGVHRSASEQRFFRAMKVMRKARWNRATEVVPSTRRRARAG